MFLGIIIGPNNFRVVGIKAIYIVSQSTIRVSQLDMGRCLNRRWFDILHSIIYDLRLSHLLSLIGLWCSLCGAVIRISVENSTRLTLKNEIYEPSTTYDSVISGRIPLWDGHRESNQSKRF